MSLIKIEKAYLSYGLQVLLDEVDLVVEKGHRLCLIGRNGAGKSSLLKVIAGEVDLDKGDVIVQNGIRIARLEQDLPDADDRLVFDSVANAFPGLGELLSEYHQLAHATEFNDASMKRMETLQQEIEARDGWSMQQKVEAILTRLDLPADKYMRELSGGWRRRVALARALVVEPDVLLLDEPTNHLDIAAIDWLEKQLLNFNGALVFITHDRSLLQAIATHIVELDRGHIRYWAGDYASYLVYREQALAEEARHNELFDKKLAEEEVWIRQGIKARRTRNEGPGTEHRILSPSSTGPAGILVSSGSRSSPRLRNPVPAAITPPRIPLSQTSNTPPLQSRSRRWRSETTHSPYARHHHIRRRRLPDHRIQRHGSRHCGPLAHHRPRHPRRSQEHHRR